MIGSHVPGVNIMPMGSATYLASNRDGRVCYPTVFLDGVRIQPMQNLNRKTVYAVDLGQFDVQSLSGVEFYAVGSVPAQYNSTAAGCGVLLLWTRER